MPNRYRRNSSPEPNPSDPVIVLPESVDTIASQTVHSCTVVTTVEMSAVTELKHPNKARPKRPKQMEKSSDIELSAMSNIGSSNGLCPSENVAETPTNTEQQGRNTRHRYQSQRTTRSSKIYPEQSASGNNFCTQSDAWPEQRHKIHGRTSLPATAVGSSSRDDRDLRIQQFIDAPKKVTFTLPAKPTSEGETAVVMDDGSSLRTLSSQSRSSPGLESMSRVSTSQSMQESDSESECWYSFLKKKLPWLSLAYFARRYYGVWLQKMPVKVNQLYLYS